MSISFLVGLALLSNGATVSGAALNAGIPNPPGCTDFHDNSTGMPTPECDAAIARETDPTAKSVMLQRRAFIEDATGDFTKYPKALADLDLSIKLWPQNWPALHERAYLYNEYHRWQDAANDLTTEIALAPNRAEPYRERAMSRFYLGDLEGTYADRDAAAARGDSDTGGLLARARAAMWLGRFDAAADDIARAQKAADPADAKAQASVKNLRDELALWMTRSGAASGSDGCRDADKAGRFDRPGLVGDCTAAFLAATTPKDRGDALTVRAQAWLMGQHNENFWLRDFEIAAALDPSNAGDLSNLGFAYLQTRQPTAAAAAFDRSIALDPQFYNYAGRAGARMALHDLDGAEADARKSNAMGENEVALTVLGDVSYARTKSYDAAKAYWISAYRLGDRDDGLTARLKNAGVPIPPPDDAAKP